jgi:sporulation protein YlmC with PRC-barrel domain
LSRRRRGRDIAIQDILGKRVRDAAGRHAGRIEEIIAEPSGSQVPGPRVSPRRLRPLERFAR